MNRKKLQCCFWYAILIALNAINQSMSQIGATSIDFEIEDVRLAGTALNEVLAIKEQPEKIQQEVIDTYKKYANEFRELKIQYDAQKIGRQVVVDECKEFSKWAQDFASKLEFKD